MVDVARGPVTRSKPESESHHHHHQHHHHHHHHPPGTVAGPGRHGGAGLELGRARHGAPAQAPVRGVASIAETPAADSAIAGTLSLYI